jgi:hypothetical protein
MISGAQWAMLLSLFTTGRLNPAFAWARYRPNFSALAELLDIVTFSLIGAFVTFLVLILIPGDQTGDLIRWALAL